MKIMVILAILGVSLYANEILDCINKKIEDGWLKDFIIEAELDREFEDCETILRIVRRDNNATM